MDLRKYLIKYNPYQTENSVFVSLPNVSCLRQYKRNAPYDIAWLLSNENQYKKTDIPLLMVGENGNPKILSRDGLVKDVFYGERFKSFATACNIRVSIPNGVTMQNFYQRFKNKYMSDQKVDEYQQFINDVYFKDGIAYVRAGKHITNKASEKISKELNEKFALGVLKHNGVSYFANNSTLESVSTKFIPEFDYNGNKYVRVALAYLPMLKMSDGTFTYSSSLPGSGAMWFKVDDIEWEIVNWDKLPSRINPKGSGSCDYLDLVQAHATSLGYKFYGTTESGFSVVDSNLYKILNHNMVADFGYAGQGFLYECFEENKKSISEVNIGAHEKTIQDRAFAGCSGIARINVDKGVEYIYPRAFEDCGFRFAYGNEESNSISFVKTKPILEDGQYVLDLELVKSVVLDFNKSFAYSPKDIEKDVVITDILSKNKISMPSVFYELVRSMPTEDISGTFQDFKFYKKQVVPALQAFLNKNDNIIHRDYVYKGLFYLATALGCFSSEQIENKGNLVPLSQKACSFLSDILEKGLISEKELIKLSAGGIVRRVSEQNFGEDRFKRNLALPQANSRLLDFLSMQGKEIKYPHLNMIINTYKEYPLMLSAVIKDFDDIEDARKTTDEDGLPKCSSWKDVLPRYVARKSYPGVEEKYNSIALLFAKHDLSESSLSETISLIKQAEENNIPHHLLGEELYESLERDNEYIYEWVDKYSPINAILGVWTDCCAAINKGVEAGTEIARNSIISPDCQNLVVRNNQGKIVAKIAGYLNRESGELLFNSFEVAREHRGRKVGEIGKREILSDDKIFEAFKRGVYDFIYKYNLQNEDAPIIKANIGYNHEVLKKQLDSLSFEFSQNINIPAEYGFKETDIQYSIYNINDEKSVTEFNDYLEESQTESMSTF